MFIRSVLFTSFVLLIHNFSSVFAGSNDASKAWLAENMEKDGVMTLASGLQYKVLREGDGDSHPTAGSSCSCHYEGKLIDGTVFDSSYERGSPSSFAPNQVIKGWTEAMQLMVEGDKWEMYIPSELGYGDGGSPPKIGGGDALVFTMEIIAINGDKVPAVKCNAVTFESCSEKEQDYVKKMNDKFGGDPDFIEEELERVKRVASRNMKVTETLREWGKRREKLLEQLLKGAKEGEKDL